MDTLSNYMQQESGLEIRNFDIMDAGFQTDSFRFTDNDIGKAMNFLWQNDNWPLKYPVIKFREYSGKKVNILSIGDSFNQSFWGFYPFFDELFGDSTQFWYYNKVIGWPDSLEKKQIETKTLDLYTEIMKRDIILIITTEQNLKTFTFDFVQQCYPLFNGDIQLFLKKRKDYMDRIMSDPNWIEAVKKKSVEKNVPLDVMVRMDAEWLIQQEGK
jgi:hypothetical protein